MQLPLCTSASWILPAFSSSCTESAAQQQPAVRSIEANSLSVALLYYQALSPTCRRDKWGRTHARRRAGTCCTCAQF